MTQGFAGIVLGSGEDTTSHSNQLLRTVKGLQWINKPDPFSPTHTCVQTPSTDMDWLQPPWQSSPGRGCLLLCPCRGRGIPPAHTGLWGQSPLPATAPGKTCSGTNPKRTSLPGVVGSSHIAEHSASVFLRSAISLPLLIFTSLQAVSRGKGNNPHCSTEGKAGLFWQREVTLTKYFTNHLLNNCYPRLKRRHITTLKIVCSTAQPWKALVSVRAVKDLFQNCQRNYTSPWVHL